METAASVPVTVSSEHTGKNSNSSSLAVHSRRASARSDRDGTNTSVRLAASRWAMNSAVKVLPVPHAMIIWPRLAVLKPRTTAVMA